MSDDNSTKTWKEWAIQTSTELENLKDAFEKHCQKNDKLVEKVDSLKESFIRLETRIYAVVAVITILIEFILRVMLKV
jgi:hypothetical protein